MTFKLTLKRLLKWIRELNNSENKESDEEEIVEETSGEPTDTSSTTKKSKEETEQSEDEEEEDDGFSMPTIPHVGSKWQHAEPWPERPDTPKNTIEVRLYWHESNPEGEQYCHQVKKYVQYCLLDAWADDGYDVAVSIHDEAVPTSVEDYDDFISWQDDVGARAKDANMVLRDLGGGFGRAGPDGGYVDPQFLSGWSRDPDDPIKPVGGGNNSPSEGVGLVLHEIGHCIGFSHKDEELRMYGHSWVSPMSTAYDNMDANNYAFRYCKDIRDSEPRVE